MRKQNIILVLFIAVMGLWACNGKDASNKELIVNTWKVTGMKDSSGTERNQDMHVDTIKFEKTGKVTVQSMGEGHIADYVVSEDGKSFTVTVDGKEKAVNEIISLTKNKFVFKDRQQGLTISLESK